MQLVELLNELTSYEFEKEWFEFKSNMKSSHEIGEYISAVSNSAALLGKKEGYLIWGIDDTFNFEFGKHLANGTKFDFDSNADNNEPLKHYLERQIKPSIKINFVEEKYENKRVVVLVIGAARTIPTSFDSKRYIRIGSSKVDLSKFPEKEVDLFYILREGIPTITNTKSKYQELTFSKLFGFYGSKGIILKETTFKKNLELLTEDGS
ncbi:MAG: ATP-binding protein, partial [Bacilli bacterium]|nr:ATP-binding protein [Bacilli bacterium]